MATHASGLDLTAHFTAQAWLRGGFLYANWFDTWEGRVLWDMCRLVRHGWAPWLPPVLRYQPDYLILRHRLFERRLRAFRPDVVIEFGAGLSSRGIALAQSEPGLRYIELDLPGVVALKRARLARRHVPRNYHLVEGDLLDAPLAAQLPVLPEPDARLLVITEGVLPYLSFGQKRRAWWNVAALLSPHANAAYLMEEYPRDRFGAHPAAAFMLNSLSALAGLSVRDNLFDSAGGLTGMLQDCGFTRPVPVPPVDADTGEPPWPPPAACPWLMLEARPARPRT